MTHSNDENGSVWHHVAGWSSSFLLRQPGHRSGWGTRLWQELRWRKRWRGQRRLRRRPISSWQHLPWNLGYSHLLPPLPPFSPPAFLFFAPQGSVERWKETEPSQLHLVIISHTPAASSPWMLSSGALTRACFRSLSLTQLWLMGISHFWFLAVRLMDVQWGKLNLFKLSVFLVWGRKHAVS